LLGELEIALGLWDIHVKADANLSIKDKTLAMYKVVIKTTDELVAKWQRLAFVRGYEYRQYVDFGHYV